MQRHLGFGLNILSLALFFPGILLPMFLLDMEMAAKLGISTLSTPIIDKELSIMNTVKELWQENRLLVAMLIFVFSVVIPLLKTTLVSVAYFKHKTKAERRLLNFVAAIGKWSMADVFVVAVFLAVLSTNHAETSTNHKLSIFGFDLAIDISSQTLSAVGQGFYFFTAYCILSLAGTQLAQHACKARIAKETISDISESEKTID